MRKFLIEIRGPERYIRIIREFRNADVALNYSFDLAQLEELVKVSPLY